MTFLPTAEQLLTYLVAYGPWVLAGILFVGALGVPFPGTVLVVAAGALVRQDLLNGYQAISLALVGVVLGDIIGYSAGYGVAGWAHGRLAGSQAYHNAAQLFARRGPIAIYITRFLLTPLAVPTNLIAGSSRYPFPRFLFFDILGELTWLLLYGGLGYLFGEAWETVASAGGDVSGLLAGVALLWIGASWLRRRQQRRAVQAAQATPATGS